MRNIFVFEDKPSLEAKYTQSKDKQINEFISKWSRFKDDLKIDGDKLLFVISNDYEIHEHNRMVDFLESNVGYSRAFNEHGTKLDPEFYKDLYDLFSDDEGKVWFSSGSYECQMAAIGKLDVSYYFELKSDGLHWREDEFYKEDGYEQDD